MPIRPENRDRYPPDWPAIRERVRRRAGDRCEGCGVRNHAWGCRDERGKFAYTDSPRNCTWRLREKVIRIVCTTAHLNHIPEDCRPENLRFWCQKCHNSHDAKHRQAERRRRLDGSIGQERLFA